MARKKKDDAPAEGTEDEGTKKKGRRKLVPAVVVGIALLGAGYLLGPGKGTTVEASAAASTTTTTTIPGPVVVLDPITLNIPGNHYLKVGMALQMRSPQKGDPAPADGEVDPKVAHAPVLDAAIDVLGGRAYEELVTPPGREAAKQALIERMGERYGGRLEDVYFTEFVLQ